MSKNFVEKYDATEINKQETEYGKKIYRKVSENKVKDFRKDRRLRIATKRRGITMF